MNSTATEAKAALRAAVRGKLNALSPPARSAASAQACARLQNEAVWREAATVLLYAPIGAELDVWPLALDALRHKKVVALPQFDWKRNVYVACQVTDLNRDLQAGRFGIREPAPACPVVPINRLDFVAVPGVAFTWDGRRLGRGKGFYDRLLATVRGVKCGVGFDEQIVRTIPTGPHDMSLDCILTPTQWRCFGQGTVLK
jgi:5-formyltetrahydrofolate cyclo-ligase